MKLAFPTLAGLIALAMAQPALAVKPALDTPLNTVCRVPQPKIPAVDWSGLAIYRALSVVKNGRVVSIEITSLKGGVDRRAQRSLIQAIEEALRNASCEPGDHQFVQTFSFEIPPRTPAAPASDTTS